MQVIVSGVTATPRAFTVAAGSTVEDLKLAIENETFVPAAMIQLAARGAVLAGSLEETEVDVMVFADAGMRAKWRKKRMRRLRRKRRKMRQRAR
jgi:hypothetical protein